MKSKILILFFFPLFFSSCSIAEDWSITAIIGLFIIMLVSFGIMSFIIFKKRRQADKSLVKYTNELYGRIAKLDSPEKRIEALKILIQRINEDEKYQSDINWKNKVLVKTLIPLAAAYYKLGNESETLKICSEIIELDAEHGMSYYNRGSIYSHMGMYEKAIPDYNKAIELMPDYASTYNNRGLAHDKLEHYSEAIEDYSKAIGMEDSAIAYFNRANTYVILEQYDNAINDYEQCLILDPDDRNGLKKETEQILEKLHNNKIL